ncbi:prohead protease [Brachybacterium faecium]|nr:prohead protease [Brachybacterium faecium]
MSKVKQTRTFNLKDIVTRDAEDGQSQTISGYASVFNSRTTLWEGFDEIVAPGAFTKTLKENGDVRCLFNHDWSKILGRTTAQTLRLTEDNHGLMFEVDLPNTSYANDLVESMQRGDINQCSFGFWITEETTTWDANPVLRTINAVELFEVSVVSLPAYDDTEAALARSKEDKQNIERRMQLIKKINHSVGGN